MTTNPNRYVTVTLTTRDHAELMRIANETGMSPKRLADAMVAGATREYGPRKETNAH